MACNRGASADRSLLRSGPVSALAGRGASEVARCWETTGPRPPKRTASWLAQLPPELQECARLCFLERVREEHCLAAADGHPRFPWSLVQDVNRANASSPACIASSCPPEYCQRASYTRCTSTLNRKTPTRTASSPLTSSARLLALSGSTPLPAR